MNRDIKEIEQQNWVGLSIEKTAKRIKLIMDMGGFSIKQISQLMNLSYHAVYKWVNGDALPEISNFYMLSRILGVTMEDFLISINGQGKSQWEKNDVRRIASYYFRIRRVLTTSQMTN